MTGDSDSSTIQVIIEDSDGISIRTAQLPSEVSIERLVLALVDKLALQTSHPGVQALVYDLYSEARGRLLVGSETLKTANVPVGSTLRLHPNQVAGGFSIAGLDAEMVVAALTGGGFTLALTFLREWLGGKASRKLRIKKGETEVEFTGRHTPEEIAAAFEFFQTVESTSETLVEASE